MATTINWSKRNCINLLKSPKMQRLGNTPWDMTIPKSLPKNAWLAPEDREVRRKKRTDPVFFLFWGVRGKGKTASMTAMAKYICQLENDPDFHVWSNFPVSFGEYDPKIVQKVMDFPEWFRDGLLLIDETAALFSSLRPMGRENLNGSTLLTQIRKRRVNVLGATQFPWQVPSHITCQINSFVEPTLFNVHYDEDGEEIYDSARLDFVDWGGYYTGQPIQHAWPPYPNEVIKSIDITGFVNHVYNSYDTDNVIEALWKTSVDIEEVARAHIRVQDPNLDEKDPANWTRLSTVIQHFGVCKINSVKALYEALDDIPGIEVGLTDGKQNAKYHARWVARDN